MVNFRIIPVMDLLNSEVVHAVKGERSKYKPLKSVFVQSSNPDYLIAYFSQALNFKEVYIADLDAIMKKEPNNPLIFRLSQKYHIKIMLDPGIRKEEDINIYLKTNITKLILGLESIEDVKLIEAAFQRIGKERVIISFDLYNGRLLTNVENFKKQTPLEVINYLESIGTKEIILLDLFRVGQKIREIPPLYHKIRKRFSGDILVGGGIRDIQDIKSYYLSGFSGVLIATALHEGMITSKILKNFKKEISQL